jgi:acetylornithine deacetylase/succinyl-diaminopimelate desuccinylase-like protein
MPSEAQLREFFTYLRFASVSADPARRPVLQACAAWLQATFAGMGFTASLHPTPGPPVVVARRMSPRPGAPTLLIYGHYDVQPADPPALWTTAPFEPVIRGGLVYARGATDNKGQTFSHLLGTQEWLATRGELPVHLIYLLDGEEEIGSPHFGAFLRAHAAELACDAILVSDTSMIAPGQPAIACGLRGIACVELTVRGPAADLHSGVFGGAVANPATELARLLAAMHDAAGRVAIPGFYDHVAPIDPAEAAGWRGLAYDDQEVRRAAGVSVLGGEAGYSTLERLWGRPTAEVNGITAGYQGPGSKTIIPSHASAKLSFRLVPHQSPGAIAEQVRAFFAARAAPGIVVETTFDHGGDPFYADPRTPFGLLVRDALRATFGREAVLVREGLSIPVVSLLRQELGRDAVLVGLGLPDCSAHGPNETFPLANMDQGIVLHLAILQHFADQWALTPGGDGSRPKNLSPTLLGD